MALDNMDGLNAKNVSPFPTALRYGLIGGGISIVCGLISYLAGMTSTVSSIIGVLSSIISIAIIVLAIQAHRNKDLGGYISYGRCLGVGVLTAIIMGVVGLIWSALLFNVIDPGLGEEMLGMIVEQWEDAGMPEDQIEQMLPMTAMFTGFKGMALMSLIGTPIFGFIVSLIGGAVMKKNRPMA